MSEIPMNGAGEPSEIASLAIRIYLVFVRDWNS
jgi:hypothetical protein